MGQLRLQSRLWILISTVFIFTGILPAQTSDLGEIDFPTSGSAQAQEHFIRGALLLHSFEYWDARAAFKKAQQVDPRFVMAYWGEAMTHNRPVWNQQDLEEGRAALNRLAPTLKERLAKAPTQREKDYLKAIDILFFDEGDKLTRDFAYALEMRSLHEMYPDDLEAAAFYALSILGTAQGERDFRIYMRAGAMAQEVFDKNPRHPGAAHYVIHSFDDPIHAPLGLGAARVYAGIAPDAPHALHMPSHIFMALGMWDESAASNMASSAASRKKGQYGHHAIWWLHYTYLQQGRYKEARKLLIDFEKEMAENSGRHTRNHVAYIRSSYIVETRQWNPDLFEPEIDESGLQPKAVASILLTKGMAAFESGNNIEIEFMLTKMKSMASADQRFAEDEVAQLVEKQLDALHRFGDGKIDKAIAAMEEAVVLQDRMSYEFGPPLPVKPVHEMLGEMLLRSNRPKEAVLEFRNALSRNQKRALSLLGLARAQAALGDTQASLGTYSELKKVWHWADPDLPEWDEINSSVVQLIEKSHGESR